MAKFTHSIHLSTINKNPKSMLERCREYLELLGNPPWCWSQDDVFDMNLQVQLWELGKEFGKSGVAACIFCFREEGKKVYRKYKVEKTCQNCGEWVFCMTSKTDLINCIFGPSKFICPGCLKAEKLEAKKAQKTKKILAGDITQDYIDTYLNPEKQWNSKTSVWQKMQNITTRGVNYESIAKYIKGIDYHDFLLTPFWKAIAVKKLKDANFKCQLCSAGGQLNVHHSTYEHHGYEQFHLNDLIVLCNECHKHHHKIEG